MMACEWVVYMEFRIEIIDFNVLDVVFEFLDCISMEFLRFKDVNLVRMLGFSSSVL